MFAHIQTNDYIFETIHSNLEKLPWQKFIPTPVDLDLIMKVMLLCLFNICAIFTVIINHFYYMFNRLWTSFYLSLNAFWQMSF